MIVMIWQHVILQKAHLGIYEHLILNPPLENECTLRVVKPLDPSATGRNGCGLNF